MRWINNGTRHVSFVLIAKNHLETVHFIWKMVFLTVKKTGMNCLQRNV